MGNGAETEEAAQEPFPDDLDQTPDFDPVVPEPIPTSTSTVFTSRPSIRASPFTMTVLTSFPLAK
jgi:hypothetical protein